MAKRLRVGVSLTVGLSFILVLAGCTSSPNESCSEPGCAPSTNESCSEFGSALAQMSAGVVNAFGVLDTNSEEAIGQLRETRSSLVEAQDGWSPDVIAAAQQVDAALGSLIDATAEAADGEEIDAGAVTDAVAEFEATATTAAEICEDAAETPSG